MNENPYNIKDPHLLSLHREADNMQTYLNRPAVLEDPASLTYRLRDLDAYLSRLSEMLSAAKAMKEYASNRYQAENEDKLVKLSATISNRMIKSHLYEYIVTADRLDTMYSTMTRVMEDLRTQISYIKQQMIMR